MIEGFVSGSGDGTTTVQAWAATMMVVFWFL